MRCLETILDARQREVDEQMVEMRMERQAGTEERKKSRAPGLWDSGGP